VVERQEGREDQLLQAERGNPPSPNLQSSIRNLKPGPVVLWTSRARLVGSVMSRFRLPLDDALFRPHNQATPGGVKE
jgi:hypothetical protein